MPLAEPAAAAWRHPDVDVARSLIAGSGLRAEATIAADEVVMRYADAPAQVDDLGPVNHSCDPNLWWADERTLVARHDIAVGAELTCDYSTGTAAPEFVLMCHCETYRCRQLIAGDDWQIPQLQKRYAAHFTPALQHLIDGAVIDGSD